MGATAVPTWLPSVFVMPLPVPSPIRLKRVADAAALPGGRVQRDRAVRESGLGHPEVTIAVQVEASSLEGRVARDRAVRERHDDVRA
jgi:hypothetical protein